MSSSTQSHNARPSVHKHSNPNPTAYEQEIYQKGLTHSARPRFTFDTSAWEPIACSQLSADAKGYVYGSAGRRETHDKNIAAFRKWSLIPRRLVPSGQAFADTSVTVFKGTKGEVTLPQPIAIAPVGVQRIFHPDGEEAVARAATNTDVPYILSTATSTSIEDVARASGDGVRWFQLYWPQNEHNDITASMLKRAQDTGYTALFVTLDTYILGWRPSDMDNGYNPFLRADKIGVEIGFSDPVFQRHFKETHGKEIHEDTLAAAAEWTRTVFPGVSHGWDDLNFLAKHWDGPIVLKGIQSVADAKKAAEFPFVTGIVVSNHGGRQQDGGPSSLGMLPRIVDAVGDKLEIYFDSGIRCGSDIAKAMALGARMCLVGRPYVYGLTMGGQEGVEHVLKALIGELSLNLHLSGIPSLDKQKLNKDCLVREDEL